MTDAATVWRPDGTFTHLQGSLPSYGLAINESVTMTGYTACARGREVVRWWADGRTEECTAHGGLLQPGSFSGAIDDQHRVWGSEPQFSFVWTARGYSTA